jgi:hypothetical protein
LSEQRRRFAEAGAELGINELEGWYKISTRALNKIPQVSSILVKYYSTSLSAGTPLPLLYL